MHYHFTISRDTFRLPNPNEQLVVCFTETDTRQIQELSWLQDSECEQFDVSFVFLGKDDALKKVQGMLPPHLQMQHMNLPHSSIKTPLFLHRRGTKWETTQSLLDVESILVRQCFQDDQLFQLLGTDFITLQRDENACAARSVEMVLKRHGLDIDTPTIDAALDPGPEGPNTNLYQIVKFCREIGLDGKGYRGNFADLQAESSPVILHVDGHHFVVLSKAFQAGVLILDPANGRQYWDKDTLESRWNGVYFQVLNEGTKNSAKPE